MIFYMSWKINIRKIDMSRLDGVFLVLLSLIVIFIVPVKYNEMIIGLTYSIITLWGVDIIIRGNSDETNYNEINHKNQ